MHYFSFTPHQHATQEEPLMSWVSVLVLVVLSWWPKIWPNLHCLQHVVSLNISYIFINLIYISSQILDYVIGITHQPKTGHNQNETTQVINTISISMFVVCCLWHTHHSTNVADGSTDPRRNRQQQGFMFFKQYMYVVKHTNKHPITTLMWCACL